MKRSQGLILTVAALAFAATTALADEPPSTPSTPPATMQAPAKATAKAVHHAKTAAKTPKTDLNSASKEDLMKLPGVDDAIADKIVAARPFKTRSELVSKNIVTSAEFAKLRTLVAAMPAPKSASK